MVITYCFALDTYHRVPLVLFNLGLCHLTLSHMYRFNLEVWNTLAEQAAEQFRVGSQIQVIFLLIPARYSSSQSCLHPGNVT